MPGLAAHLAFTDLAGPTVALRERILGSNPSSRKQRTGVMRHTPTRAGAPGHGPLAAIVASFALLFPMVLGARAACAADPYSRPFRDCLSVNPHFGQHMPLSALDWVADVGATWIRDEVFWDAVETAPGVYAIPQEAQALKLAAAWGASPA